ncbi:hypothetical protein ACFLT9_00890 [Acidobacteriota bacterium]
MKTKKAMSLALLDLCAFAVSQVKRDSHPEALHNYRMAYRLAEINSVPNIQTYRDYIASIKLKR